jgi:glycosyltransferase involved in cell wall biosynthesis
MKVSVLMLVYNQRTYVEQAIESVLMQTADFKYELIIGDDCSTDGTWEILDRYAQSFPQIKLLGTPQNLGMVRNFARVYRESKGQYLCILEGDDYWTDPRKLQRQADYLDKSPQCYLCFDRSLVLYDEKSEFHITAPFVENPFYSICENLLKCNFIMTASVMYRKFFSNTPVWFQHLGLIDLPMHIMHATKGDVKSFNEIGSVYRVHSGGIWSNASTEERLVKELVFKYLALKNLEQKLSLKQRIILGESIGMLMDGLADQIQGNRSHAGLADFLEEWTDSKISIRSRLENYAKQASIYKRIGEKDLCRQSFRNLLRESQLMDKRW